MRIDAGLPPCRELPCGAAAFFFGKGYFAAGAAKRPPKNFAQTTGIVLTSVDYYDSLCIQTIAIV